MVDELKNRAELRAEIQLKLDEMESAMNAWTRRIDEENERFAEAHADFGDEIEDLSDASPEYREVAGLVSAGELTWNDVLRGTGNLSDEPAVRAIHNEMNRQVRVVREVYELRQGGASPEDAANAVLRKAADENRGQ
ncbi:hypothetical protein [Saccharopolyspora taberi]|uniref:hypothetical protein n=1 Tax=Saccharopolyspora taberi TaxID=60895 RepID=UPI0031D34BB7